MRLHHVRGSGDEGPVRLNFASKTRQTWHQLSTASFPGPTPQLLISSAADGRGWSRDTTWNQQRCSPLAFELRLHAHRQ
jgi:hypothetical protein